MNDDCTRDSSASSKQKLGIFDFKWWNKILPSNSEPSSQTLTVTPWMVWKDLSNDDEDNTTHTREKRERMDRRCHYNIQLDYYILLTAATLGLGNAFYFPTAAFNNGRGIFILVYSILSVFIGIPLLYLEVSWGQFCNRGPIEAYNMAPLFKGVGISSVFIVFVDTIIYPIRIVYAANYIFVGDAERFSSCTNYWNTAACVDVAMRKCTAANNKTRYPNGTCYDKTDYVGVWNITAYELSTNISTTMPGFEYLRYVAQGGYQLTESSAYDIDVALFFGLTTVWFCCFAFLHFGLHTMPKVMVILVGMPQLIMIHLIIRSFAMMGDNNVFENFLTLTSVEQLQNSEMYFMVFKRVSYSLGIGYGVLTTIASYNRRCQSIFRPLVLLVCIDLWTSLIMGLGVFCFIGDIDKAWQDKVSGDKLLVFELYAFAPLAWDKGILMAATFFFASMLLSFGPMITSVMVFITAAQDNWPSLRRKNIICAAVFCAGMFLMGVPLTTKGSFYLLTFIESYTNVEMPFVVTFFNLFVVIFIYGYKRYYADLRYMLDKSPPRGLKYAWSILMVVFFVVILIPNNNGKISADQRKATYLYGTAFGIMMGWLIYLIPMFSIPLVMLLYIFRKPRSKNFYMWTGYLLAPSPSWPTPRSLSSSSVDSQCPLPVSTYSFHSSFQQVQTDSALQLTRLNVEDSTLLGPLSRSSVRATCSNTSGLPRSIIRTSGFKSRTKGRVRMSLPVSSSSDTNESQ